MTKAKRIFISNRLPFGVDLKNQKIQRGSGGLVSALLGVGLDEPFWWVGFETSAESAQLLSEKASEITPQLRLHPVVIDSKLYDRYYDRFCNDVLWPLFHYESQHTFFQRENWDAYVAANRKMADEILQIAGPQDTVWIHDFHFMLLPEMLRRGSPQLKIGFFLHTPFPSHEMFRQLPVREVVLKSMVQCDLIGFHEHSYLRHFTVSLKAQLGVDSTFFKAQIGSHTLHLGVYPISVDTMALSQKANSAEVFQQTLQYQDQIHSHFLVLGVDRLDYTKGLELKLKGFRRALQKYPELRGQINLLQVAIPTRVKVPSYIRLKRQIDQLVGKINGEFGSPGYSPVSYIFNSVSETELLALYRRAESLLITSKRDGMNLVAIEYAISQSLEYPGVLIVSEFAGVSSLLGHALIVNPWDEDSIADNLYRAFKMPQEEARERLKELQDMLTKYSASQWAKSFLSDLDASTSSRKKRYAVDLGASRADWPEDLKERLRSRNQILLVLDYDGTVVQLEQRPELAVLSAVQKDFLRHLQKFATVAIVSGRTKGFLDEQFQGCDFLLAAEHGAFVRNPHEEWRNRISSDIHSWYSEVKNVMAAYADRVPMSFVEQKEAALVWHFRQSPPSFADFQARKLDDELQVGLANQPVSVTIGAKIVEAKALECNKGNFLRWLLSEMSEDTLIICIGDDRTDEDMFGALGEHGISIKVGDGMTTASYRLPNQRSVALFLGELLLNYEESCQSSRVSLEGDQP